MSSSSLTHEELGRVIGNELQAKLREPQNKALRVVGAYLKHPSTGSGLVHMPTGSGKTGVIALTAGALIGARGGLVVTHRAALRDQLVSRITRGFFDHTVKVPNPMPKAVEPLTPSRVDELEGITDSFIFVATAQALTQIRQERPGFYDLMRERLGVVIFDEGHYEPSRTWSSAIRSLDRPTILFSATPYRNDVLAFNIDMDYVSSTSYHDSVAGGYVRGVRWEHLEPGLGHHEFAKALVKYFKGPYQGYKPVENPKVLVRCATEGAVTRVASALVEAGESVLAIHDNYGRNTETWQQNVVPDVREASETFFVHQFKLLEGVDEPRFSLVALYEPPSNARAVVQQIGRVIRATGEDGEVATVVTRGQTKAQQQWEAYEEFEEYPDALIESIRLWQGEADVVGKVLPDREEQLLYVLGEFRKPMDPSTLEPLTDLLFRPSARLFLRAKGFDPDALQREVVRPAEQSRIPLKTWKLRNDTHLTLWVAFKPSPITSLEFTDRSLGYTIYRLTGELVIYSDSDGWVPERLKQAAEQVRKGRMQSFVPSKATTRVTDVSLQNTDPGRNSLVGKSLRARDLGRTARGLTDYAQVPSSTRAVLRRTAARSEDQRSVRRYVGLSSALVTDEQSPIPLDDYLGWLDDIESEYQRGLGISPVDLFRRYAVETGPPADTTPKSILLDVPGDSDSGNTGDSFQVDEPYSQVVDDIAHIGINETEISVKVSYERERDRYLLSVQGETSLPSSAYEAIDRVTAEQSFRVVSADTAYIYVHGSWYKPAIGAGSGDEPFWSQFLPVLTPIDGLQDIHTEKGRKGEGVASHGTGWRPGSLFEFVDRHDSPISPEDQFDVLVCDDLGPEVADFIALSTDRNQVVLMHLKVSTESAPRSAAKFRDVCMQAVTRLRHLNPFDMSEPPNLHHWSEPWKVEGIGTVRTRLRRKPTRSWDSSRIWSEIHKALSSTVADKEVWIVFGGGFSKSGLQRRLASRSLTPEDVHFLYEINSTWSAVNEAGGGFRVFCSP